ncbi:MULTISPECIES: aldo/keto reductase [unclassified Thermotoga]|uniref:aldo/keto reductase n=1 Tax=unclassified Thermotoga TaxID=2631113 RepID=UPI000280E8CE|nr:MULTISPECIES: aldo/keto reductase [unclassified Thermotoga]AIY86625.1 aldo/keto reductase [Thermotoga sp. 2812B]EJX25343.1 aldo/keto reductase [Thermotoga sp. EMP]
MIYKELGRTGEKIPALGLGTWGIGGFETPDYSRDEEMVELLKTAIKMGYTHIDTAEYYGGGHTEELIGRAIKDFRREDLFIVSKVWPTHLRRDDLLRSLENTLKRLDTDYVDLYLIHWPNPEIPLEETLSAMAEGVRQGLIRYIGVSNFDRRLLEEAIVKSQEPIVCDQVKYNIEDRDPERDGLLEFCQKNGVTLVAYSPLRRTLLSEKTKRTLEEVAKNHGATIYQIMLAWLLAKPNVVAIPKAGRVEHLRENLKATEIKLSEEEMKLLDSLG